LNIDLRKGAAATFIVAAPTINPEQNASVVDKDMIRHVKAGIVKIESQERQNKLLAAIAAGAIPNDDVDDTATFFHSFLRDFIARGT
jgi:hypothetical protein